MKMSGRLDGHNASLRLINAELGWKSMRCIISEKASGLLI
jgi:hypothetical protein